MVELAVDGQASGAVHVFYGTVTGNAEEIARRISVELSQREIAVETARSLEEFASCPGFTSNSPGPAPSTVVIVVSTTGDGDPPDVIRPFMRNLRKFAKEPASLSHLSYAILGLGDTNYENFCNTAKKIDSSLIKAGAKAFLPRGLADDGVGLELVVEPWLSRLYSFLEEQQSSDADTVSGSNALVSSNGAQSSETDHVEGQTVKSVVESTAAEVLGIAETDLPKKLPQSISVERFGEAEPGATVASLSPHYIPDETVHARVVGGRKLTEADAVKTVYAIELDCSAARFTYSPGDAFGVLVQSAASDVEAFLPFVAESASENSLFELKAAESSTGVDSAAIPLGRRGSIKRWLFERTDLRAVPKKTFLRALSEHCESSADAKQLLLLSSKVGKEQYSKEIMNPGLGLLDVLRKFGPSCKVPLEVLLDHCPVLAPRYYSAASTPEVDGDVLHFAFSVVPDGLATQQMARQCEAILSQPGADVGEVLLVPRAEDANSAFRPPKTLDVPYIMVGPGTGVAPFRGFLRQRSALAPDSADNLAKVMLFFGCRNEAKDFLFEDELRSYDSSGTSISCDLDVAFSRDGPEKVYVQDRILARAPEVASIIDQGGSVFVCGDGGGMAKGVDRALLSVVTKELCDGDELEGKAIMKSLSESKRYVRDIWYFGALDD